MKKQPKDVVLAYLQDNTICMIGYHSNNGLIIRKISDCFEKEAKLFLNYLNKKEILSINNALIADFCKQITLEKKYFNTIIKTKEIKKNILSYKYLMFLKKVNLYFFNIMFFILFALSLIFIKSFNLKKTSLSKEEQLKYIFKKCYNKKAELVCYLKNLSSKINKEMIATSINFDVETLRIKLHTNNITNSFNKNSVFDKNIESKKLDINTTKTKILSLDEKTYIFETIFFDKN